ncbi:lipopolysaccharide biosynthesis protein [Paenibacillus sp. 7124]|uniref:Lipopolysaccharide biosynthesis protein n=1 Tax=Paenibacillus apii TaxID=1850370 RepID=A0A6M1PML9_9BACL|nr:lipopolysaccharide biosynthesis protein [Paenibacillus apii]NGM83572.1 lipopolysaccharide biosynthesis protein [Paenibacillus apii]
MSEQELKKNIFINFAAKYSNTLVQLVLTSILARILQPNEFGVVALVSVFITFFNLIGDMGIGPAIIQKKELEERDHINIFNFTLVCGFFLAVIFALSGNLFVAFFNNPAYLNVTRLLSLAVFFSIAAIVPQNLLYKFNEFKSLGVITIVTNLITGIIAIVLARIGFSYYSLIIQIILMSFIKLILMMKKSGVKLKLQWGMDSIKSIKSYSGFQFAFNFVNYFSRNFDSILISKTMGSSALGYYDKAYKLMLYPLQSITFVITPVLHPALSKYQDNTDYILDAFKKLINLLSIIGGFFTVFCFYGAENIIVLLFGDKWIGSVPTFQILSISLVFQMVSSSTGAIFQATNNFKYLFISGLISSALNIIAMVVGGIFGRIEDVAIGIVIAFSINFFQTFYILARFVFNKPLHSLLSPMKYTIIICLIMIIFLFFIPIKLDSILQNTIVQLFVAGASFILGLLVTKQFKVIKKLFVR